MRVLHVYSGNRYGGIEVLLRNLAELQTRTVAVQSSFLLFFAGLLNDELQSAGADVTMLRGVRFSRPWTVYRARRALAGHLRVHRPEIVICHEPWAYSIAAP